jgi:hypothetical protein
VKPGDLVRYKKEFEHRAEYETNGVLVDVVVNDISEKYFPCKKWHLFETLFDGTLVNMFSYEVELVNE